MTGSAIRLFFRELLGSRLVSTLELDLLRLRADYDLRLQELQLIIATLREEKAELNAKVLRYETTLLPLSSRAGADVIRTATKPTHPSFPKFDFSDMPPIQTRWGKVQADHEAQMVAEDAAAKEKAQLAQGAQ